MVKAVTKVTDLEGAIKVWEYWQAHGVPRGQHLGLYIGLRVQGAEASPSLFGVRSWRAFPGA